MTKPTAGSGAHSASLTPSMPDGYRRGLLRRPAAVLALLALIVASLAGCGSPEAAVDTAPFEVAVTKYLAQNDMALRLKGIRTGPIVDGDRATMSGSMTHRDLGGPSVVWEFQFQRAEDGPWTVVSHHD